MKYQKYDFKSYTIHTIKTDNFKNGTIEFSFRNNIDKESILDYTMIADLLTFSSKKFPKNKMLVMEKENLYNLALRGISSRVGNSHMVNFVSNFLDPKYCDKGYMNDVIDFLFEVIYNPNVKDDEFDNDIFKIIKNQTKASIEAFEENSNRYAFQKASSLLDPDNSVAINFDGELSDLELITPSRLYKKYIYLLNNFHCDIFIIGNFDMDDIVNKISKKMTVKSIKNYDVDYFNTISVPNKVREVVDKTNYEQAKLLMCYNLVDLTDYEKNVVMYVFNFILGGGSFNSKLVNILREKNFLCYTTTSIYQKFDSILIFYTALDYVNYKKAYKLSKVALKEMVDGKFSDQDIEEAKISLVSSAKMLEDSIGGVLTDCFLHVLCDNPLIDEFSMLIKKVTKEEIIALARKLKLNLVYFLSNEGAQ